MSSAESFWNRVDQSGGPSACWPWKPRITHPVGYGQLGWEGRPRGAHTVAYELAAGAPAKGYVCHSCDNPPCCNPAHLSDGTPQSNMDDRARAGHYQYGSDHWSQRTPERVLRNEGHPMAVLSDLDVAHLRADRAAGMQLNLVAIKYGISVTHTKRIVYRKARNT